MLGKMGEIVMARPDSSSSGRRRGGHRGLSVVTAATFMLLAACTPPELIPGTDNADLPIGDLGDDFRGGSCFPTELAERKTRYPTAKTEFLSIRRHRDGRYFKQENDRDRAMNVCVNGVAAIFVTINREHRGRMDGWISRIAVLDADSNELPPPGDFELINPSESKEPGFDLARLTRSATAGANFDVCKDGQAVARQPRAVLILDNNRVEGEYRLLVCVSTGESDYPIDPRIKNGGRSH